MAFEHVLPHPDGQRLSYMCYAALVDGDAPEITLSWEHSSYQWLTPDELMQQPITPQTDYPFAAAALYQLIAALCAAGAARAGVAGT